MVWLATQALFEHQEGQHATDVLSYRVAKSPGLAVALGARRHQVSCQRRNVGTLNGNLRGRLRFSYKLFELSVSSSTVGSIGGKRECTVSDKQEDKAAVLEYFSWRDDEERGYFKQYVEHAFKTRDELAHN